MYADTVPFAGRDIIPACRLTATRALLCSALCTVQPLASPYRRPLRSLTRLTTRLARFCPSSELHLAVDF